MGMVASFGLPRTGSARLSSRMNDRRNLRVLDASFALVAAVHASARTVDVAQVPGLRAQLLRAVCLALQGLSMAPTCLSGTAASAVEMKRSLWNALQDGLGSWFWQHNWGSPKGFVHPAAHLHQFEIDARRVAGVGVDLNDILKPQFGQWD